MANLSLPFENRRSIIKCGILYGARRISVQLLCEVFPAGAEPADVPQRTGGVWGAAAQPSAVFYGFRRGDRGFAAFYF